MYIINSLVPVFLAIALGAVLCRTGFISAEFTRQINRLTYWVGLPALLFYETAAASYANINEGTTILVFFFATAICIILAYIVSIPLKLKNSVGTFVQISFRGNLAFVGLPVIIYSAASAKNVVGNKAEVIAILLIGVMVPIYNIIAVIALLAGRHQMDRYAIKKIAFQLITNPLLISCAAGLIYSAAGIPLPLFFAQSLKAIGQMALPLALLGIGSTLVLTKISRENLLHSVVASLLKVAVCPLAGYFLAKNFGLGLEETTAVMILLACPTAVASYVLTGQLKGNEALAANTVVISSVLSVISLSVAIAVIY